MPNSSLENGKVVLRRTTDERKPLVQRINRIEGQLRGVRLMIEEDRHCSEELLQIKAAMAALREVALAITEQHVAAAVGLATADSAADESDRETVLHDLMRVLRDGGRL